MNDGHLQIGYHGCDVTVRDALVSGSLSPESSDNQYDWLGPGFYMFEGDADRALAFAEAAADQPQRRLTARPIATPAVVGCIFSVHRCLDMTTKAGRLEFASPNLQGSIGNATGVSGPTVTTPVEPPPPPPTPPPGPPPPPIGDALLIAPPPQKSSVSVIV